MLFPFLALAASSSLFASSTLEAGLAAIQKTSPTPALGAALVRNGQVADLAVVGVRKSGDPTPAQPDDRFHLGSCTKAMTATLLATFVEEGKLRWDAKLGELFPTYSQMDAAYREVRLDQLLAHRGGLPANPEPVLYAALKDSVLSPTAGRELVAATILSQPPAVTPGSAYHYSNVGYMIAGRVLENLSGKTWEALIFERLFHPLGMTSCGFGPPGNPIAVPPDQPWGHFLGSVGLVPLPPGPSADNPPAYSPAGRVHCSLADWGKFAALHLAGFRHESTVILHSPSFEKLHTSYPDQTYTYGGWERLSQPWAGGVVLAHEGTNSFNYADVWLAPLQNRALLSVANSGTADAAKAVDAAIGELIRLPP